MRIPPFNNNFPFRKRKKKNVKKWKGVRLRKAARVTIQVAAARRGVARRLSHGSTPTQAGKAHGIPKGTQPLIRSFSNFRTAPENRTQRSLPPFFKTNVDERTPLSRHLLSTQCLFLTYEIRTGVTLLEFGKGTTLAFLFLEGLRMFDRFSQVQLKL